MTHSPRHLPRRGSNLLRVPTAELIGIDPRVANWDSTLLADGWTRCPTVQPRLNRSGDVSVRFVWRKRGAVNASFVYTAHWELVS